MPRGVDHLAGGGQVDRHRLLHLDVHLGLGAEFDRRKAEIGESAQVDEVHLGVPADFLICGDELGPAFGGELSAGLLIDVRADGYFAADVPVGL